ncbi:site-2 protease family protein [Curvibacter sp. CHRR-16]|uniref:site-2 protease family protein n=1 Tax=Curvibacter sp. CHRR-16 TaxID=2835872 RepID=UPI001BD9CC63|nr:site-2 protease family protein [Curvibacter sp. CHRR-16]
MDISDLIQTIAVYAIPVLFAVTLHEAAHGYAALYFGDNTAAKLGRLSLNPARHIDPVGTILIPLLLLFATSGNMLFGYAKPVPVRFGNLRHPKRDMIWVALAGPAANLAMAWLWGVAAMVLPAVGVQEPFFLKMCNGGLVVNIVLFAFNLFPLPPLDGGRILVGLLPLRAALWVSRIEPWGFFIVMGLVLAGILSTLWMRPVMGITFSLVQLLLSPLQVLLN